MKRRIRKDCNLLLPDLTGWVISPPKKSFFTGGTFDTYGTAPTSGDFRCEW